jgi:hypothetical protein
MMICILIFAITWEAVTEYLERRFEENKAHSKMLDKVYNGACFMSFSVSHPLSSFLLPAAGADRWR